MSGLHDVQRAGQTRRVASGGNSGGSRGDGGQGGDGRKGIFPARLMILVLLLCGFGYFQMRHSIHFSIGGNSEQLLVENTQFPLCDQGEMTDCVVDGATFIYDGQPYALSDVQAPQTIGAACAAEGAMGARAAQRLVALLNLAPFELHNDVRDTDAQGHRLKLVVRDGQSIGAMLLKDGLVREWTPAAQDWCSVPAGATGATGTK